jgi:hypothetical protein
MSTLDEFLVVSPWTWNPVGVVGGTYFLSLYVPGKTTEVAVLGNPEAYSKLKTSLEIRKGFCKAKCETRASNILVHAHLQMRQPKPMNCLNH